MAIHVAALCQESLSYDEFTRRALEQEAIAQQKSATGVPVVQLPSVELGRSPNITPALVTIKNPGIAGDKNIRAGRLASPGANRRAKTIDEPKKSLRQRLMAVSHAWDDFRETRDRDAVYDYLRAVFSIVQHYRWKSRTKKLIRRAFEFGDLPFDKNADPFAVIILCTCEEELDRKTVSKWSRALRYVALVKKRTPLKTFMKNRGGINACASLYTQRLGQSKG